MVGTAESNDWHNPGARRMWRSRLGDDDRFDVAHIGWFALALAFSLDTEDN
jgi:hypothetical protein